MGPQAPVAAMASAVPVKASASDLIDWSLAGSVAVMFPASRSPSYDAAVNVARGADRYAERLVGKTLFHWAGFGRTRDQAARALAVVQYLGAIKGFQVFAGGAVLQERFRVERVLECYIAATGCADHRAHCVVMVDGDDLYAATGQTSSSIFVTISAAPPPPAKGIDLDWLENVGRHAFPCRFMRSRGFRYQRGHPSDEKDQLQAAAVREGCDWCPNLKSDADLPG